MPWKAFSVLELKLVSLWPGPLGKKNEEGKKKEEKAKGEDKEKDRKGEHWEAGEEAGVVPLPGRQPLHLGLQKPSSLVESHKGWYARLPWWAFFFPQTKSIFLCVHVYLLSLNWLFIHFLCYIVRFLRVQTVSNWRSKFFLAPDTEHRTQAKWNHHTERCQDGWHGSLNWIYEFQASLSVPKQRFFELVPAFSGNSCWGMVRRRRVKL